MKKLPVIFIALLAIILSAQPGSGESGAGENAGQKSSSRRDSIRGRIITDDGQPLVKATVNISAVRNTSGVGRVIGVEEDGRFEVAGLAPGMYRLFVSAPGYATTFNPADRKLYRPGDSVIIKLVRGGVITGTVSTFTGEPVVSVPVRAIRIRDEEGRPLRSPAGTSRPTDDRGVYRLYGLQPGSYLIAAGSGSSLTSMQFSDYIEHSPTYYPSATRDTAVEVAVRSGQEITGADIRYRAERGYTISGSLTGKSSSSNAGNTSVLLRHVSGGISQSVQFFPLQGNTNSFAIHGVADGEYELTARNFEQNGEESASPARRVTVKGSDVTGIELMLAPLGSVSGRIVIETTPSPCKKDRILLVEEIALAALQDRAKEEARRVSESASDEKQEFSLRRLEAATYRLDFNLPDLWYVRAITLPSAAGAKKAIDAARDGIAIKSGEKVTGLIVTVAEGAASLSGRIVTEKEKDSLPSRTRLYLVPAEKEQADNLLRYAEMIVKSDGVFAFANIAPGRYRLVTQAVADEEILSDARPAAWDIQSRRKLFGEAETTGTMIELKPCQKVVDHLLHFPSTANKKSD